jgi:hypothetical protein
MLITNKLKTTKSTEVVTNFSHNIQIQLFERILTDRMILLKLQRFSPVLQLIGIAVDGTDVAFTLRMYNLLVPLGACCTARDNIQRLVTPNTRVGKRKILF